MTKNPQKKINNIEIDKKLYTRSDLVSTVFLLVLFLGTLINIFNSIFLEKELLNWAYWFVYLFFAIFFFFLMQAWYSPLKNRPFPVDVILLLVISYLVLYYLSFTGVAKLEISVSIYAIIIYIGCETILGNGWSLVLKKILANFIGFILFFVLAYFHDELKLLRVDLISDTKTILLQYISFMIGITYKYYHDTMIHTLRVGVKKLSKITRNFADAEDN